MTRLKGAILILLVIFGGSFSTGCTAAQRAELMDEAKEYVAKQVPLITEKAVALAEAKLKEKEAKTLAALDAQLAQQKQMVIDPETGLAAEVVKKWQDFDDDKDGSLSPGESVKASTFIMTRLAQRVAAGEISKGDAADQAKDTGWTIGVLSLLYLGKKGVDRLKKKPATPGNPPPPGTPVVNGTTPNPGG